MPEPLLQQREGTTDIGYLIRADFDMMRVYETFDGDNLNKILLFKVNGAAFPLPSYPHYQTAPQTTVVMDLLHQQAYVEQEKNIIQDYTQSAHRMDVDEMMLEKNWGA